MQQESPPNRSMLLIAYYCGLTPLVAGITIFLLWCVTGNRSLDLCGILNIMIGMVLFLIGMIALCMYCWQSAEDRRAGRSLLASFLALVILLLNFPVCGMILYSVDNIQRGNRALEMLERPIIHIHNGTDATVTHLEVIGAEVGSTSISNGETVFRIIPVPVPNNIMLKARQGDIRFNLNFNLPRQGRDRGESVVVVLLPKAKPGCFRLIPINLVSTIDQRNIVLPNEVSPTY